MIKELAALAKKGASITIKIDNAGEDGCIRALLLVTSTKKMDMPDFKPLAKALKGTDYQEIERKLGEASTLALVNEKVGMIEAHFNKSNKSTEPKASSASIAPSEPPVKTEGTQEQKTPRKRGRPANANKQLDLAEEASKIEMQEAPAQEEKPFVAKLKAHLSEMDANLLIGEETNLSKWVEMARSIKSMFKDHLEDPSFIELMNTVYGKQKEEYLKKTKGQ